MAEKWSTPAGLVCKPLAIAEPIRNLPDQWFGVFRFRYDHEPHPNIPIQAHHLVVQPKVPKHLIGPHDEFAITDKSKRVDNRTATTKIRLNTVNASPRPTGVGPQFGNAPERGLAEWCGGERRTTGTGGALQYLSS